MSSTDKDKIFKEKVIPIMDKVREDLQSKQADEYREHAFSLGGLFAGAAGPDGGMSATAAYNDTIYYTGKWNTKTTEDYIGMVKAELKRQHIAVDDSIEKMMIDKMVNDRIPKSSIDYIIKKSAQKTIFHLPQEIRKSPLEVHIESEAEKRYNPSDIEKGASTVIGSITDYLCLGGVGGGWKMAATWLGGDLLVNEAMEQMDKRKDIPFVIMPGQEEAYLKDMEETQKNHQTSEIEMKEQTQNEEINEVSSETTEVQESQEQIQDTPENTNTHGWNGLLTSFGLNGLSDITHNLGYVLAMLPDMLVGIFTGKTKSLKIQDNLMPLATLLAGMFVKNPILKMVLMASGGLNLLNKAGHEALDNHKGQVANTANSYGRYKKYEEQPLNERIINPQIKGNCLIATIDKVPCTIALSPTVVDAYNQGALPLSTLANAVLAKNDQMRQMASENYAANEQGTIHRQITQR